MRIPIYNAYSMRVISSILILLVMFSCENSSSPHPVFDYYPNDEVFKDGYVNKYYYHYYPDDTDASAATEVGYTKYRKLSDDRYITENYNAGYELVSDRFYLIKEDTVFLEKGSGIDRWNQADTISLDLIGKITTTWKGSNAKAYQIRFQSNDKDYLYSSTQKLVYDSLILNKPAKVFYNEWQYQEEGKDSLFNVGSSKSYYVANFGFFGSNSKGDTYKKEVELIEQMSIEEFKRRASHGIHRIGYIDPENTLDEGFEICGHEVSIMDYYNSEPSAKYKGGKGEMERIILSQLDKQKLEGQNGMLTFRFVVNCNGDAGRFIAEGFDFNYQEKEFSQESIAHLLEIIQGLNSWQSLEYEEMKRDAYVYITFKIRDEEIFDILP